MTLEHPEAPPRVDASALPAVIQGGMGVGVSSWQLARAVAAAGGLGVVSGVAADLVLARWLQDGDPDGTVREALAAFPDQAVAAWAVDRHLRPGGRPAGTPYKRVPPLDLTQRTDSVRLAVLGSFVQVHLAKREQSGPIGINLLEKIQAWTPALLLGAVLAGVDVVLVGAGVPAAVPSLLDGLSAGRPVSMSVDVAGADSGHEIALDPAVIVPGAAGPWRRPAFLAIVSAQALATYLARDPVTRPDGFVVEGPVAGGHSAPPRGRLVLDEQGDPVYGDRDIVDPVRFAGVGLPFWLAGGFAGPDRLRAARAAGAHGVQVGTAFALCAESGLPADVRTHLLTALAADDLHIRNDPLASPTGFPFKLAALPGTAADDEVYLARDRRCDLGHLRTPYTRPDGSVGYRCPAEPEAVYVRKGGDPADTEGRRCLCNGLSATVGIGQVRRDGYVEPPLVTLGQDLQPLRDLMAIYPEGWDAADVLAWLGA